MKAIVYGRPSSMFTSKVVDYLIYKEIEIEMRNLNIPTVRRQLIRHTGQLQKKEGYTFTTESSSPTPIVVLPEHKRVVVGYSDDMDNYKRLNI